jgi:serine/threonine protein kinase
MHIQLFTVPPFSFCLFYMRCFDLAQTLTFNNNNNLTRMLASPTTSPRPYRGINPALNFPADHTRGTILGKGSEGTVESWTHLASGFILAVKIIKHHDRLPAEVQVLKDLPLHPSIIRLDAFYANALTPHTDCLIFEYCAGGDLLEFKKHMYSKNKAVFSEAFMWSIYHQLSDALATLHEGIGASYTNVWKPIVHRDIKAQNILISSLGPKVDHSSLIIKLADFGLSTFSEDNKSKMSNVWGTTYMWPPEQTWENRIATTAGDIWAIGHVMHELAHGFPPILDWRVFAEAWGKKEGNTIPKDWNELKIKSFCCAKTTRRVLPINVETEEQQGDARRKRACPKYSDELNECLMAALKIKLTDRATAGSLRRKIEEAHAAFLFEELRMENEAAEKEMAEYANEEWDDHNYVLLYDN